MSDPVRWEIEHTSVYDYDAPVQESQNELRGCPTTDDVQTLLHHRAASTPGARVQSYVDYWGTRVETFGVRAPHERLEVVVESTVSVGERPPAPRVVVPLDVLGDVELRGENGELLGPTPLVGWTDDHVAQAMELTRHADGVWTAASALRDHAAEQVELVAGRTPVERSAAKVLADGSGSPRDRAHVLAMLCRARGIPTLYVSGHRADATDQPADQLHAWVEVLVPGHGWHALDPAGDVGTGHVTIGRGRDHADVAPLRGTFIGGDEHELVVTVTATRVADLQTQQQAQQQQ